jgi:hypothetical protein
MQSKLLWVDKIKLQPHLVMLLPAFLSFVIFVCVFGCHLQLEIARGGIVGRVGPSETLSQSPLEPI